MEGLIMRDKTILAVGSQMELPSEHGLSKEALYQPNVEFVWTALPREDVNQIAPTVEKVMRCECVSCWKRALEKPWRFLMKLGPGYRYPTKSSSKDCQDGEGAYIYY